MASRHLHQHRSMFHELFFEFGVKNEDELRQVLMEKTTKLPCVCCGKPTNIELLKFIDGDPVCKRCGGLQ